MWLNITPGDDSSNLQLAVLDMQARQVTNYCVNGNVVSAAGPISLLIAPLWSPNGKQILVVDEIPNSPLTGNLSDLSVTYTLQDIMVDITNNTAEQIGEGYRMVE